MGQVAGRQAHVVLDGAVNIIAIRKQLRSINHSLDICAELSHALGALAQRESEISKVVNMSLEQFTAHGKDTIEAS